MDLMHIEHWIETHPGTAAWCQAIGAILAIYGSAFSLIKSREKDAAARDRMVFTELLSAGRECLRDTRNLDLESMIGSDEIRTRSAILWSAWEESCDDFRFRLEAFPQAISDKAYRSVKKGFWEEFTAFGEAVEANIDGLLEAARDDDLAAAQAVHLDLVRKLQERVGQLQRHGLDMWHYYRRHS